MRVRLDICTDLQETRKTMKEPRTRKGEIPPEEFSNKTRYHIESDTINNNCDITCLTNDLNELSLTSESSNLQKPLNKKYNHNIGNGNISPDDQSNEDFVKQFASINITDKDTVLSNIFVDPVKDGVNIRNNDIISSNISVDLEEKDKPEQLTTPEKLKDEDSSENTMRERGPTRREYRDEQRMKSNPYQLQVQLSPSNRNSCGGYVYMESSCHLGPSEKSFNIDQLQQNILYDFAAPSPPQDQLPLSPPFLEKPLQPEDDLMRLIDGIVRDPKTRDIIYSALPTEETESFGTLGSPSSLDTPSIAHSMTTAEQPFFSASPRSSMMSSPEYSMSTTDSPFLSPSPQLYSKSSPNEYPSQLSPYQVVPNLSLSQDSVDGYVVLSPSSSLSEPGSSPDAPILESSFDGDIPEMIPIDFLLPEHPSMKNIMDKMLDNRSTQPCTMRPVYTPILSPGSFEQLPVTVANHVSSHPLMHNMPTATKKVQCITRPTVNIYIPINQQSATPQRVQNQLRSRPRPILPAPKPVTVPSKDELLKLLDPVKKKESWIKIHSKEKEELSRGDGDGDTFLMVLVSQKRDSLYELVYATVEYLKIYAPDVLNVKNKSEQTALYNACISLPTHPLVARFLAETLLSSGVDISKDKFQGRSLVEEVKKRGNSHSEILNVLLNLKTAKGTPVFCS